LHTLELMDQVHVLLIHYASTEFEKNKEYYPLPNIFLLLKEYLFS
jgi:hypothetical protein